MSGDQARRPGSSIVRCGGAVGVPLGVKVRNGDLARITVVSPAGTATAFASPQRTAASCPWTSVWQAEAGKTTSNPLYFSAKEAGGRKADQQFAGGRRG